MTARWPDDAASSGTGLPLEGVRVLDLSRILAGPLCVLVAADLGADVIKVESPAGDGVRAFAPPTFGGDATYYLAVNRNRRSVVLDLHRAEGRDAVAALAREADAVVENFLPHQLEALGLAELRDGLDDVVWVSVRGAAEGGPEGDLPSFDLLAQARSGLMAVTGEPGGPALKVGAPLADVVTGLYAAAALLAGLYERATKRRARRFEVPLLESTITALVNQVQGCLVTGVDPQRLGNQHPNIAPYGPVPTSDGELVVAVATEGQFSALCGVLGDDVLSSDERFATNAGRVEHREALLDRLGASFGTDTAASWSERLSSAGVPCGPVNSVAAALAAPQVADGGFVATATTRAGTFRMVRSPIKVGGEWLPVRRPPPALDEHGDEVRDALGVRS